MTNEIALYEAELTNPETGEVVTFKGRMVDVGYFLKLIKDQIWQFEKEIKNNLGSFTWKQIQENPGSQMTRHYEGDIGKVTVKVNQEPQFNDSDINELMILLGERIFHKLFKPTIKYKPMMRELKKYLNTTSDNTIQIRAKEILEDKMKYTEMKFNVSYEKK